jgi:hypothetical protein
VEEIVKFEIRNLKSEEAGTRCARLISPGDAIRNSIHSNLRRQSRRLPSHA